MKRDDLTRAVHIEREVQDAERRLAHFRHVTKLDISSACCLELQDYPEPSVIGVGFRAVQGAIVSMLEAQLADAQARLRALGVTVL
jgi:hypothetical protein